MSIWGFSEGILSLGIVCPAAMKSTLESGGGVGPTLRIGRGPCISLRGGTSAMAPSNESSPSSPGSHGRVCPAHSADRRKTHISLWNRGWTIKEEQVRGCG